MTRALAQHAHDVGLLHDQKLLAVELDLGARPLAEQHAVAALDVDRDQLAGFVTAARPDRHDPPLLVFSSASIRLTTTRSCSGRNLVLAMTVPFGGFSFQVWFRSALPSKAACEYGRHSTPSTARTVRILSNRALGVLIVRPGIWLGAYPVKQTQVKTG